MQKRLVFNVLICFWVLSGMAQEVLPGAEQLSQYLPLLKGKKVAVFANQTSLVGGKHLVDVLQENKVNVKLIFGPEHGFRGKQMPGKRLVIILMPKQVFGWFPCMVKKANHHPRI